MVELVELGYLPEVGKFELKRDDKSYLLTLHELVAMLRDFEVSVANGLRRIELKVGPHRVLLPEAPPQIYVQVLESMKAVWTSFRRSRYGLGTN